MIEITRKIKERAMLVAFRQEPQSGNWLKNIFPNLKNLLILQVRIQSLKSFNQNQPIDPAFYIGKGKAEELAQLVELNDIDLVISDDDLTPVQVRNLERLFNRKIIDRSGLILDIFALRAKTKEAKTQVELAQLEYMLPRLTRAWTHLSKQYGGIGTKGPGETQIETDRRMIRTGSVI